MKPGTILMTILYVLFCLIDQALAQTALAPVAPSTDWTGVAIVSVLGVVFVAIAAYIVHIKRTPGQQLGEDFADRVAEKLHIRLTASVPAVTSSSDPLTFDGKTFASVEKLEEYKAAKAVIDQYRKE